jgi:septation ring formation regulator EzrA
MANKKVNDIEAQIMEIKNRINADKELLNDLRSQKQAAKDAPVETEEAAKSVKRSKKTK